MAPFPIVTSHNFGGKISERLISYSYPYTLESRAGDSFSSRNSQQVSSASGDLFPRITTEFRRPTHTAGAGWHNAHEPYTLKHLSIWAYLAFGLIVLWVSFVTVYACFRCCQANIVRLDTCDGENSGVWKKYSAGISKRRGHPQKLGRKGRREISAGDSEIEFLGKRSTSVEGLEASLGGEISWIGSATSQSMVTGHGRLILIGLPPPSLGSTSTMDTSFPGAGLHSGFTGTQRVRSRDDPRKVASVDLFNIPFASPKDSGSMSELWREPKLSPVRGSIIRPKPAVTVVSRRW